MQELRAQKTEDKRQETGDRRQIYLPQITSIALTIGALAITASPTFAQQSPGSVCPAQLPAAIRKIIAQPIYQRSHWGILVQTLGKSPGDRQTLFAHDAEKLLIPASNTKLLTTAAALHKLGTTYRVRTSVYGDLKQPNLTLRVVGRGDPSLGMVQLQQLANQLKAKNIRRISTLIGDDSYFKGSRVHPNWDWEDVQAGYGAPVNSLMYKQNAIDLTLLPQQLGQPLRVQWQDPSDAAQWQVVNQSLTVSQNEDEFVDVGRDFATPTVYVRGQLQVGSSAEAVAISSPRPGNRFLQKFRMVLTQAGISVDRVELTTTPATKALPELAVVESPTLAQLVQVLNQDSDNLYAEAVLNTLGRINAPSPDTTIAGITVVLKTLVTELGVKSGSFAIVDGSGLARRNLVSPEALVATLQAMAQTPEAAVYRASLPIAGVSGTLKSRFLKTPAANILQAKTGTLTGVTALSGYITPPNYSPLVFSILVNNTTENASVLRSAVDAISIQLATLRSCRL
jgi:D-alanyl-D-alanine carboxypeptidase/D-alanyl-D-alanine-endopeptidase (penicillin-binding protein 4)